MRTRFKKITAVTSLSCLALAMVFFASKQLEQTVLIKTIKKSLGIKTDSPVVASLANEGQSCVQPKEDDKSTLFVGCNGIY